MSVTIPTVVITRGKPDGLTLASAVVVPGVPRLASLQPTTAKRQIPKPNNNLQKYLLINRVSSKELSPARNFIFDDSKSMSKPGRRQPTRLSQAPRAPKKAKQNASCRRPNFRQIWMLRCQIFCYEETLGTIKVNQGIPSSRPPRANR